LAWHFYNSRMTKIHRRHFLHLTGADRNVKEAA